MLRSLLEEEQSNTDSGLALSSPIQKERGKTSSKMMEKTRSQGVMMDNVKMMITMEKKARRKGNTVQ